MMTSGRQEGERGVSEGSLSCDGLYRKDPEAIDNPGYDHPNVNYRQEPVIVADEETLAPTASEASEEKATSKSFKTWIPYVAILVLLVALIILAWQFAAIKQELSVAQHENQTLREQPSSIQNELAAYKNLDAGTQRNLENPRERLESHFPEDIKEKALQSWQKAFRSIWALIAEEEKHDEEEDGDEKEKKKERLQKRKVNMLKLVSEWLDEKDLIGARIQVLPEFVLDLLTSDEWVDDVKQPLLAFEEGSREVIQEILNGMESSLWITEDQSEKLAEVKSKVTLAELLAEVTQDKDFEETLMQVAKATESILADSEVMHHVKHVIGIIKKNVGKPDDNDAENEMQRHMIQAAMGILKKKKATIAVEKILAMFASATRVALDGFIDRTAHVWKDE